MIFVVNIWWLVGAKKFHSYASRGDYFTMRHVQRFCASYKKVC